MSGMPFRLVSILLAAALAASAQADAERKHRPKVAAFHPTSGKVGIAVVIAGWRFTGASAVTFGGVKAAFKVASDRILTATVPAGAVTGPVRVTTPEGTDASTAIFTVEGPAPTAPVITSFAPLQGPAGTLVLVKGSGFTAQAKVAFNGVAAAATFLDATQLRATVPAGAATGPITVTTAAGTSRSGAAFTVPGPSPSVNLSVGGWYLIQSVQTLGRSVPLVAGRDAYLRVFPLATGATAATPSVRVTLTGGSPSPWVQTIPAPGPVPTALDEGSLGASWNVKVPGSALAPGGTLKVELDPAGAFPDANPADNTVQAALEVKAVKPFRITVIPVTQQGLTGNVASGGRVLASWADRLQRMYPLSGLSGAVEVLPGTPYTTQANLNTGSAGWSQLLGEIEKKRKAEAGDRYYYGAVNVSYAGGQSGLGYVGAPSAIGWDKTGYADGGNYPETLAHEVGHNFGRKHAPCGGAAGPDAGWPTDASHANAQIGVFGFDLPNLALKTPGTFDIMSYCHPDWVSDYTYKGVADFRAASPLGDEPAALPPATPCLLVSGSEKDGRLTLGPAYTVTTRPSPPEGCEYVLELLDAAGRVLRKASFGTVEVADLPGGMERQFSLALPIGEGVKRLLRGMRVVSGHRVLAERRAGFAGLPTPPVATSAGEGRVRLTWNAAQAPDIMVRDPRRGEVLAFASGGVAEFVTDAMELEVELSNGVASNRMEVKVAP